MDSFKQETTLLVKLALAIVVFVLSCVVMRKYGEVLMNSSPTEELM